ncbi:MAG: MBL fold metallo-hydrolase [Akkermansiaceae bacterium]|nr:MBL fold metallo-hydrolase [Akkermansiaceae bacterium]NNM30744.1 MBL fold metallo-hydrolase [Akkermansiaceae bacterium]
MAATADGDLHVYMLNVGQGDTTVIVSPQGNVMVVDAVRPDKLQALLDDLGLDGTIEHLVITHPHDDHFRGGNRLALDRNIQQATVAPFWHTAGMGPPTYRRLIAHLSAQTANVTFLSGYSRWYPDGSTVPVAGTGNHEIDPDAPFIELLGASTGMVRNLQDANVFNPNHLSIMGRITWRQRFRMIIAADAQMENWAAFDEARLLEDDCQVLRSAHHGSANGTQWERIDRLAPREVIVSSEPDGRHHLPDLTGSAIFAKFDSDDGKMAVLTHASGTVHLRVTAGGTRRYEHFGDTKNERVDLANPTAFDRNANPTDWPALLDQRVDEL